MTPVITVELYASPKHVLFTLATLLMTAGAASWPGVLRHDVAVVLTRGQLAPTPARADALTPVACTHATRHTPTPTQHAHNASRAPWVVV
jgi:hypothetical protein